MSVMHYVRPVALVLALAAPAAAQTNQRTAASNQATVVSSTEIQRLQDQVYDASNEISRMRSRDQATADRLQTRLDDLRDDVVYLRVKLRREGSVSRTEYNDVRGQIESVRSEARAVDTRQSDSTWGSSNAGSGSGNNSGYGSGSGSGSGSSNWPTTGTAGQNAPRRNEVPSGTELDVRLERELNSDTAQVEDRFTATTLADLYQGNSVLIPAGSTLRGVVSSVQKASRTERKGALTVAFDQMTVNGRSYPIHGTVTQALESEGIKGEIGKIGAGAGVGAILGGIIGGAKGALLGILIGGGGTIAATEGKDVKLPAGTVLRVRMEQPVTIR
jgi:TolA-binding protein